MSQDRMSQNRMGQNRMSQNRMSQKAISRRGFLRGLGLGVAAAPLLGELALIREAFAESLPSAAPAASDSLPFADLGASYRLDPAVTYLNHASIGTSPASVLEAHRQYLERCEE